MLCEACSSIVPRGERSCPTCGISTPLPFSLDDSETLATTHPGMASGSDETLADDPESLAIQVFDSERWSKVAPVKKRSKTQSLLVIGSILGGRYEILTQLGEGGMGAVYKARDREVERLVALKIIRPELAGNESMLRRFRQELVITRQITHRNVVRIFDMGVLDGVRFISMEFIDGQELANLLKTRSKLPPEEAAALMLQVCTGLQAAHSEGIVHRDLKPQNVMIDRQGRVAVMDFGIAHLAEAASVEAGPELSGSSHLTQVGALMGTPRYMAPEQARSEPTDQRSDIFTVGAMLFELVHGEVPMGSTLKEHLQLRKTEPFPDLCAVEPETPEGLSAIVAKCVQLQPADRYQSVPELIEALEFFLGLRQPAPPDKMGIWRPLTAAISLVAVGLGILIIYERSHRAGTTAHAPVNVLLADFSNNTGNPVLNEALESIFSTSVEGASFITAFNRGQAKKIASKIGSGAKLDENAAKLVARREGVGVVISGAVRPKGSGYVFSAKAADSSNGKVIDEQNAYAATVKDVPEAVNRVAARIRRALGDKTSQADQLAAAETFSSASLEASQKYALGQEAQWNGQWNQALELWKQSIALDPNMGRAYAGMAATLANMGRRQDAEKMYKLAMGKLDRMSEREKLRTRGGYFLLERNYGKAIEQFRQLTNEFPFDSAGLANLALAYFYQRDMPSALKTGQAALALHPDNLLQMNNVGLFAMYSSDFSLAIRESQELLKRNPAFEKAYVCLALAQLASGDRDASAATYQKLASLSPSGASEAAVGLADLAMLEGRFADAVSLLDQGLKADLANQDPSPAAEKWIMLSEAFLDSGSKAKAISAAERAVAPTSDESVLYPAAVVQLRAGNESKALALADQLGQRFDPDSIAYGKLVIGEQLLNHGKLREAIDKFTEARKSSDTWAGRLALARAYVQAGLYTEADAETDILVKRKGEATALFLNDEPSYRYFAPVYYYQGRAKQGLQTPDASEAYKSYVALRANSRDPLVQDAKRRLANLQ
jgi:serine/threonine protein kinase/tetratricopeptide (TPR) repeat protein